MAGGSSDHVLGPGESCAGSDTVGRLWSRSGRGLMLRVLASSMMGNRAVISAGAGCCRAGQRVTVIADEGRVPRSVTVAGHGVVLFFNDRII